MADRVSSNSTPHRTESATSNTGTDRDSSRTMMDTSSQDQAMQQMGVIDDTALQTVLSSLSEAEMNAFLDELNKNGRAYLPSIGQTIELLTVNTPADASTTMMPLPTASAQTSADSVLQQLKTLIQQPPADIVPMPMEPKTMPAMINPKPSNIPLSRQARTANTYGGTPVIPTGNRPGTAVKSTITAPGAGATIRKPVPTQSIADDRMFFGRTPSSTPATIGQGQYHHRTGLLTTQRPPAQAQSQPGQQSIASGGLIEQGRRITPSSSIEHSQLSQRRPLSWFQNRPRRHSSADDADSDLDSSPPPYSISSSENIGPTRRSARVRKPKEHRDFVTFPLLDQDEHGNPVPPTPSSMPMNTPEDDEDDFPYRLMDYARPSQQSQSSNAVSSIASQTANSSGPGRKPRTVAEMRATTMTTKKQPRWPDDELYHVKSFVPLIMPQQITHAMTMKNKTTMCKPIMAEREVEAKPTRFTIATQTEMEHMIPDVPLVTLPVPIYLPSPTPSYRLFRPRAIPIPVPVFVPIMIPVPRKAFKNIQEYLQTQRDLLPDDPFQAALIMHAESLVRAENQPQPSATHVQQDTMMMDITRDDSFLSSSQAVQNLPELDLEAHHIDPISSNDSEIQKLLQMLPDAAYRLKWTYGVQAFQQWCEQRNRTVLPNSGTATAEDIERAKDYLVKSDLLSYTDIDELQQVMHVFIQETRRPTGETYLPESIYYLCLGIQFYLKINNRHIDLFDPRHMEFNTTLNKILLTHTPRVLPNSNICVSLIDEDLLYDVHQMGTISPWALLTTLIYTNSKSFNLKSVEAHQAISFANFGKYSQWGRLTTNSSQTQQMNYLRFFAHNPDLKSLADSPTVYEITEQSHDPARCPIKQYDFYVSKCPEEIRGTADVFYLRPLVDQSLESPIWYSNEPLSATIIEHILNRLKLLPDFYMQTKPLDTGSSGNLSTSTAMPNIN